jgi:transposase-like protein
MEQNQNGSPVKQRTVRSEEQILTLLEEYEKSGFSAKEYCELGEINEATFYSWLRKYRSKSESEEPKGFAAIEVIPTLVTSRPQLFAEVGKIKLYKEVPAEYLKTLLS